MNKYIFTDRFGKKVTKYEIVAETMGEAQMQLSAKLEIVRGISVVGVGLPDYVEPVDYPADITLKTFNITYRPDPDVHGVAETITYKAESMKSAHGKFINDYPEQAGEFRETHSPLSNYAVDRENEEASEEVSSESVVEKSEDVPPTNESPIDNEGGFFDTIFTQVRSWAKLFTAFFVSLIGLGLVASVLFGIDGGFGVVTNIKNLLGEAHGLTGLVVVFLVYFLFIKSDKEEKT